MTEEQIEEQIYALWEEFTASGIDYGDQVKYGFLAGARGAFHKMKEFTESTATLPHGQRE